MSLFLVILQGLSLFVENNVGVQQAYFHKTPAKHLPDSIIASTYAQSETECSMHCTRHQECLSVNYKVNGLDKGLCQLNNNTISEKRGMHDDDFVYLDRTVLARIFVSLIIFLYPTFCGLNTAVLRLDMP